MTDTTEARCFWCGKWWHQHEGERPAGAPQPRVPCLRLKAGFLAEAAMAQQASVGDGPQAAALARAALAVLQGKGLLVDWAGDRYVIDSTFLQALQSALDEYYASLEAPK